uniref:Uncharacterized protein n=1 Tax=Anopheles coluzzii TaxID=1518534 RepID=A0A8W7P3B6_ANOCL
MLEKEPDSMAVTMKQDYAASEVYSTTSEAPPRPTVTARDLVSPPFRTLSSPPRGELLKGFGSTQSYYITYPVHLGCKVAGRRAYPACRLKNKHRDVDWGVILVMWHRLHWESSF